ncbi:MAG: class I SAM-dependent methyltransferase, partial [Nanoarchaeota archaeon]
MRVTKCRICSSEYLNKIFSLGNQPIANNLLNKPGKTSTYPLDILQCTHCRLIQLSYVVPKKQLYEKYFYVPSVSKTNLEHFRLLTDHLILEVPLERGSFVVDIGGNDGSLLSMFRKKLMKVLNIEPAKNLAQASIKNKVPIWNCYFDSFCASSIVREYGKAKLVTATNSFAHIDNLHEYLKALDILLSDDGMFFAQFPDVQNLLKENQFDTIYHEHLSYFSHESLYHLFAGSPFEIVKIESNTIHGGSMQLYVRRRKPVLENFVQQAANIRVNLVEYLEKQKGKRIVAFGAAAKGITLLNYCKLDNTIIEYIADGTKYKQGKYAPGVNIPIFPEEELLKQGKGKKMSYDT